MVIVCCWCCCIVGGGGGCLDGGRIAAATDFNYFTDSRTHKQLSI